MRLYRKAAIYFGWFVSIFFGWYGLSDITAQVVRLRDAVPVDAVIVSSDVEFEGRYLSTPVVRFTYEVDGRKYTADTPYPALVYNLLDETSIEIASRFTTGDEVTAYYLPSKPGDAYLIRSVVFWPYFLFVVFGMAVFTLPWRRFRRVGRNEPPRSPVESERGWYKLSIDRRAEVFWQLGLPLMLVRFLLVAVALIHYYEHAESYEIFANITAVCTLGGSLFGAFEMCLAFLNRPSLPAPNVFMGGRYAMFASTLKIRIEQPFRRAIGGGQIKATLECVQSKAENDPIDAGLRDRKVVFKQEATFNIDGGVDSGGTVQCAFDLPLSGGKPSTPEIADDEDRTDWELTISTVPDRGGGRIDRYCVPVRVRGAGF